MLCGGLEQHHLQTGVALQRQSIPIHTAASLEVHNYMISVFKAPGNEVLNRRAAFPLGLLLEHPLVDELGVRRGIMRQNGLVFKEGQNGFIVEVMANDDQGLLVFPISGSSRRR